MNPETNKFEKLNVQDLDEALEIERAGIEELRSKLLRPDGSPVPTSWIIFTEGELVEIKGYTFKVCYIGETSILFEPVSPIIDTTKD